MSKQSQEVYDFFTGNSVQATELLSNEVRWVTRESTPSQSDTHMCNILRGTRQRLGYTGEPDIYSFIPTQATGTGNLKWAKWILETHGNFDAEYFDWLHEKIKTWLNETPQNNTLYLIYPIRSRVCRPVKYTPTNQVNLSDEDLEILRKLFRSWFNGQVKAFARK